MDESRRTPVVCEGGGPFVTGLGMRAVPIFALDHLSNNLVACSVQVNVTDMKLMGYGGSGAHVAEAERFRATWVNSRAVIVSGKISGRWPME